MGPLYGMYFDRSSPVNKRRIMIFVSIFGILTSILIIFPFVNKDKVHEIWVFYILAVVYGIANCGLTTTGGPIRSFAFTTEKSLILSFAIFRFLYYLSIAIVFFSTLALPPEAVPIFWGSLLGVLSLISGYGLVFRHKY